MLVSAEGRVEYQERNQTATFQEPVGFVFGVQLHKCTPSDGVTHVHSLHRQMDHFLTDISNQVEHQKCEISNQVEHQKRN